VGTFSAAARAVGRAVTSHLHHRVGGAQQTRVVIVFACVLGLSAADTTTVGASAVELRNGLHISNTDIGLLVTVTSLVAAVVTVPFGALADRIVRTKALAVAVLIWGAAMLWSASAATFGDLVTSRAVLGAAVAASGPFVASLVGDYFPGDERGRVYGYILAGELAGAGFGFVVTGDVATLSWRAAFGVLALPALALAVIVWRLPEPERTSTAVRGSADDPRRPNLIAAARHVLSVRTNVLLIFASTCGYYFLAGLQTFGLEFVKLQYDINQIFANGLLFIVGIGAIVGVLAGGTIADALLHRGHINARVVTCAVTATLATIAFIPAIFAHDAGSALPYLTAAVCLLSAQNPPLDAARLDVIPAYLWGRAEAVRTVVRSIAQAFAPLFFGLMSDHLFGGGRSGLQWTFVVMLVPMAASAYLLFKSIPSYAPDARAAGQLGLADA
jgi:predicted MFS family arabinose efflux permease